MMENINPDAKFAMYMSTLKKKQRIKEIKIAEKIIKEALNRDIIRSKQQEEIFFKNFIPELFF